MGVAQATDGWKTISVQKCGEMKDYNKKITYKFCTMITNTLTGYDNDAWPSPFKISRLTCTELNSYHEIKSKACNFLTEIKNLKVHVHMKLTYC
jgi:hypothetical protein